MKYGFLTCCGIIGSFISNLYGGWSDSQTTLLIFMGIDFASGLYNGWKNKSSKTNSGGLSSTVCWNGLAKKVMTLLFILVGARLDLQFGTTIYKDGLCVAFIMNELLSIIENAKLMGLWIPPILEDALDILNGKKRGE